MYGIGSIHAESERVESVSEGRIARNEGRLSGSEYVRIFPGLSNAHTTKSTTISARTHRAVILIIFRIRLMIKPPIFTPSSSALWTLRNISARISKPPSKPDKIFFKNRPQVTQMKSKYLYKLGIVEEQSFTEKFQKEIEIIKIEEL